MWYNREGKRRLKTAHTGKARFAQRGEIMNIPLYVYVIIVLGFDLLVSIGYCFIFKKCNVVWYLAFIPFVREYNASLCAE